MPTPVIEVSKIVSEQGNILLHNKQLLSVVTLHLNCLNRSLLKRKALCCVREGVVTFYVILSCRRRLLRLLS
jgi:hypothetical protein